MKIVYVAGKYLGETHQKTRLNIDVARNEAEFVWSRGCVAICPHLNSAWMSGICDEKLFYDGYLELVTRCDALLTCWNWNISKGAMLEVALAEKLGIPVFHSRESFMNWIKSCEPAEVTMAESNL